MLNQSADISDDSFYHQKRLITTKQVANSNLEEILPQTQFNAGPGPYVFDAKENCLELLFPSDRKKQLLLVASKIAQCTQTLMDYLDHQANILQIGSQIMEVSDVNSYWEMLTSPQRFTFKSFVKNHHVFADRQLIYLQVKDSDSDISDVIVRSSRGQVLMSFCNCSLSQLQSKLIKKLKGLFKWKPLCIFLSNNKYRTIDLSIFDRFTEAEIDFAYVHFNFQISSECLHGTVDDRSFYTLKVNPKIHIFKYRQHAVAGSALALRLAVSGHLDAILTSFKKLILEEEQQMQLIPISSENRGRTLKYAIINLIRIQESQHIKAEINQICHDIIKHCLIGVAMCLDKESSAENKPIGHFPQKMGDCKFCRVCLKNYNDLLQSSKKKKLNASSISQKIKKPRKSKYMCEECSMVEDKTVPLCVVCFKQYHNNMSLYSQNSTYRMVSESSYHIDNKKNTQEKKQFCVIKTEPCLIQNSTPLEVVVLTIDRVERTLQWLGGEMREFRQFFGLMTPWAANSVPDHNMVSLPFAGHQQSSAVASSKTSGCNEFKRQIP